jgi:metal-responsive CopG/Arc/MetJ family transcriptional regulator
MVRIQIYLTEKEKRGLDSVATSQGVSRSEVIRKAIDDLLARQAIADKSGVLDEIAGVWSWNKEIPKIRGIRRGWRQRSM